MLITLNKTAMYSFRKVQFTMERASGYGQYYIRGFYRGKAIKVHSTDSEAFDFLHDDSNDEKHQDAKRHCYNKIVEAYKNL